MNIFSQETLHWVEENDAKLTEIRICDTYHRDGVFISTVGDDYSRLGAAIGENTHLQYLVVNLSDAVALDVTNSEFYEGLKQNSSIHKLRLDCRNNNIAGGVGQKILEAYKQNNNLTLLSITFALLQNGGENVIAQTLRRSTNLRLLSLASSNITDEQLLPMVDAIREHPSFEYLNLNRNRIGNDGCEAIATLLSDPKSNLHTLNLFGNGITDEGAVTLANSLANNTKLRELWLKENQIDQSSVDIFKKLLCDVSSINTIYSSNHTLQRLGLPHLNAGSDLDMLELLNECTNKSHVAIKKILKYHPNIDMEPFFEWNMEGEGERNLKALPYTIAWFEKAEEAVADDEEGESYKIDERKLSAMYQFVKAMPLLFVPAAHIKVGDNKRKRNDK